MAYASEEGARDPRGVAVHAHGVMDVPAIAPRDHDRDGDADRPCRFEHEGIATHQAIEGEPEATEGIALVRIGASQEKDEIGPSGGQHPGEGVGESLEVLGVLGPILELDVECARDLPEGVVPPAVHGEREARFVACEDVVRPIPLVHIEIDDRDASDPSFRAQRAHRDGDIVEDTESLTMAGERVMRAAGEIHRDPLLQCVPRRFERPATGPERALHQTWTPGESHPSLLRRGEATVEHVGEIGGVVDPSRIDQGEPLRVMDPTRRDDPLGHDRLSQERVFGDREAVAVGERDRVVRARPDVERHADLGCGRAVKGILLTDRLPLTPSMPQSPLAALERTRAFAELLTVVAEHPDDHAAQASMITAVLESAEPEALVMAPVVGGLEVNGLPADVPVVAPLLQRAGILELGLAAHITEDQLAEVVRLLARVASGDVDQSEMEAGFRALAGGTVHVRFRPRAVRPTAVIDRLPEEVPLALPSHPTEELGAVLMQLEAIATLDPPDDDLEREAVARLIPIVELASKHGRDDEMIDGLHALLVVEQEAQRDPRRTARRQAITEAFQALGTTPLIRRVAELRIVQADGPDASVTQAILRRFKDDGVREMLGYWSAAPTPAQQDEMLQVMRTMPRLYEALDALIRGRDVLVARSAIAVLADVADGRAEEVLREHTRHPHEKVRRAALGSLARCGSELAQVALVAAVNDDIPAVRLCAIQSLARPRCSLAVPRLAAVLEKERNPDVLAAAVMTLGVIATAEAVALLERLALGKVRAPVASSPAARIDACRALLAVRSPAAMVALQHVASKADPQVRSAALQLVAAASRRGTTTIPAALG